MNWGIWKRSQEVINLLFHHQHRCGGEHANSTQKDPTQTGIQAKSLLTVTDLTPDRATKIFSDRYNQIYFCLKALPSKRDAVMQHNVIVNTKQIHNSKESHYVMASEKMLIWFVSQAKIDFPQWPWLQTLNVKFISPKLNYAWWKVYVDKHGNL